MLCCCMHLHSVGLITCQHVGLSLHSLTSGSAACYLVAWASPSSAHCQAVGPTAKVHADTSLTASDKRALDVGACALHGSIQQNKTGETATKHNIMHVVVAWASTRKSTELVPKQDKLNSW